MTPDGLLVLDKPRGPTSHDAVAHVRRVLHTRSVGHAGTLDPMASGVLLILVGSCTKLSAWLTLERKRYDATLRFGVRTDTFDALGKVTSSSPLPPELSSLLAAVERGGPACLDPAHPLAVALQRERMRTNQVPPLHAAIKQGGVPAYQRARRGECFDLPPRGVRVFDMTVTGASAAACTIDVSLEVSKGYYVRAWARDLGDALGVGGHLTALRRTSTGPFGIAQASGWDDGGQGWLRAMVPVAEVARAVMPQAVLTEQGARRAWQGQPLTDEDFSRPPSDGPSAWFAMDGTLVAVGDRARGRPAVLRGFAPPGKLC